MASRRVLYGLLEPVKRPYFAPYRQKQQNLQRRQWISNVQESKDEENRSIAISSIEEAAVDGTATVTAGSTTNTASSITRRDKNAPEIPWYLRNKDTIRAIETLQSREPLPEFPPACPDFVLELSKYMVEDLGLVDLTIVDLRNVRPASPFGPNAVMILCTGKSPRHLNKAGQGLILHIKQTYNKLADTEGILSSNFLRVYNRRLRKKAQRQGTLNRDFMSGGAEGSMIDRTGSWVVLDTKLDGLYIHLFVDERRSEVDLEGFWKTKSEEDPVESSSVSGLMQPVITSTSSVANLIDLAPKSRFEKRFILPTTRRNLSSIPSPANVKSSSAYSTMTMPSSSSFTSAIHDSSSSAIVDDELSPELTESESYLEELQQWSLLGDFKRCIRLTSFAPESTTPQQSQQAYTLVLKAHINDLTIKQKNAKSSSSFSTSQQALVPTSDVVTSFVNIFPTDPTPMQWRLRLVFLQKIHALNEKVFPLSLLVEHTVLQQASGIPISSWDVEMVVTAIAYSNQFSDVSVHQFSIAQWEKVCDEKLQLIMQVHDVAFRSTGELLSASDTLLALLYRLCFSSAKGESISPKNALENPTPIPRKGIRAFVDNRSSSLFGLFGGEGGVTMTKPLVILVLSVLVNGGLWPKFWSLWSQINRYTVVDEDLLAVMISVVTKSGDERNITYMLERYLPSLLSDLSRTSMKLLPESVQALEASLQFLDPEGVRYKALRQYLDLKGNRT